MVSVYIWEARAKCLFLLKLATYLKNKNMCVYSHINEVKSITIKISEIDRTIFKIIKEILTKKGKMYLRGI